MTLWELEQKLTLARQQGAEDNDTVAYDLRVEDGTGIEPLHHTDEVANARLVRCDRQEIRLS